jgi:hypothetical protein
MTLYSLISYHNFGGTDCVHLQSSIFLRNVGIKYSKSQGYVILCAGKLRVEKSSGSMSEFSTSV